MRKKLLDPPVKTINNLHKVSGTTKLKGKKEQTFVGRKGVCRCQILGEMGL